MELKDLPGIGKATANKLRELGIENIEQISKCELKLLEDLGVKNASEVLKIAKESIENKPPEENSTETDENISNNIIGIWKIKNGIPNFLFKAFSKTLENPEKLNDKELDKEYDKFMKKELF